MRFAPADAFDSLEEDEELHQDLFVDLLDSAITRRGGTYRAVAARARMSDRYLRHIRDQQRPATLPVVDRLIEALPHLTRREADSLRDLARRARPRQAAPSGALRRVMDECEAATELQRLLDEHHRVTLGIADLARAGFPAVMARTNRTLKQIGDLFGDPLTSAHLQIVLCNVLNFLDEPAGALRAARLAQAVLKDQPTGSRYDDPRLTALRVEAIRAEAMTLHNLHLDGRALACYDRADRLLPPGGDDPQGAYVALGRISSLIETRRFRIGDIKLHVDRIDRACDRGPFSRIEGELLVHRARRGLVAAYVRHHDRQPRTERLLDEELQRIPHLELAGPIHRVQLAWTVAEYLELTGEHQGRTDVLQEARRTAAMAGLDHQRHKLEEALTSPPPIDRSA